MYIKWAIRLFLLQLDSAFICYYTMRKTRKASNIERLSNEAQKSQNILKILRENLISVFRPKNKEEIG